MKDNQVPKKHSVKYAFFMYLFWPLVIFSIIQMISAFSLIYLSGVIKRMMDVFEDKFFIEEHKFETSKALWLLFLFGAINIL